MYKVSIPRTKLWDSVNETFFDIEPCELLLEHSLVSISLWESRTKKVYLSDKEKTEEETMEYVRCMTLNDDVNPYVYYALTDDDIRGIKDYIDDTMTATWFSKDAFKSHGANSGEQVTSELIYYYMLSFGIPVEFEHWHFNRLITLLKICMLKNQKPKKKSSRDILARNRKIAAKRRAARKK